MATRIDDNRSFTLITAPPGARLFGVGNNNCHQFAKVIDYACFSSFTLSSFTIVKRSKALLSLWVKSCPRVRLAIIPPPFINHPTESWGSKAQAEPIPAIL